SAPAHTYASIGFKTVMLTVTDSTGCAKTITKPSYVQVEQLFPSTALTTGTTVDLTGASFVDDQTGIFTLADGNCIVTLDTGNTWAPSLTGNTNPLTGGTLLPGNWFITGENGTIMISTNNGASWNNQATGTLEKFTGSSFSSVSNGFAVGTNGTISKYDGANWNAETSGTSQSLNAVEALSSGNAIAVGNNQTILFYNGSTWTPQTSPSTFDIKGIEFSSNLSGYAVGTNGRIIKTIDGGSNWTMALSGVTEDFNGVTVQGPDSAWATGTGGVVYTTSDNGASWIRYSVGHLGTQTAITKHPTGKGHVVGQGGNGRVFGTAGAGLVTGSGNQIMNGMNTFLMYPNPTANFVNISMQFAYPGDLKISLKDVNGRELKRIETSVLSGPFKTELNIEEYSSGIYFIHVREGENYRIQKLIIQK
nr:YCF48-related protein [Bacteroidota bacterium]